jgi:hypothetical protein
MSLESNFIVKDDMCIFQNNNIDLNKLDASENIIGVKYSKDIKDEFLKISPSFI